MSGAGRRWLVDLAVGCALAAIAYPLGTYSRRLAAPNPPQRTWPLLSDAAPAPAPEPRDVPSTAELCALLGPADFAHQGVTAGRPEQNGDGPGSAYCVYSKGVELDGFVDQDAAAAHRTYRTILENVPMAGFPRPALRGIDEGMISPRVADGAAVVAVRSGRLSFDVGIPAGPGAEGKLLALAQLVLARGAAYR